MTETGDVVDVDEHLGRRESQLQHGNKALTSSQHLGLAASVGEEGDRLVERAWRFIAEP
jgi:hypothetical protein